MDETKQGTPANVTDVPPLPYAVPPGYAGSTPPATALWNPNAAGCWSLLFSPIFGAYLHARNWEALGEAERAAASRAWVWGAAIFMGVLTILPSSPQLDRFCRVASLALLLSWYFAQGRAQARYVKERFGNDYPRKRWGKPLLIALAALIGYVALCVEIGAVMYAMGFGA